MDKKSDRKKKRKADRARSEIKVSKTGSDKKAVTVKTDTFADMDRRVKVEVG